MPHRKVIREWLIPLSNRVTVRAISFIASGFCDLGRFFGRHGVF